MSELLKHKNLQSTLKELNEKFGMKLKFITTRENAISQIVETVGNLAEEQQEMLSPEAVDIYNALLVGTTVAESAVETATAPGLEEDMCQAYGTLYDGNDPECQACDQAEDCQEKTMQAAAAKSAAKKEKKVKEAKEKMPKAEVAKSRYGHKVGSMSAEVDDLLWKGSTVEEMVTALMEKFGKDKGAAASKVKGHLGWLKKQNIVEVVVENDIYKVNVESV